ncbi:unnamed protein product, partial [Trichogramma brassicae]
MDLCPSEPLHGLRSRSSARPRGTTDPARRRAKDRVRSAEKSRTDIERAYGNFGKLGEKLMTMGACISRMEQLKIRWAEFEAAHKLLQEDPDVDPEDPISRTTNTTRRPDWQLHKHLSRIQRIVAARGRCNVACADVADRTVVWKGPEMLSANDSSVQGARGGPIMHKKSRRRTLM